MNKGSLKPGDLRKLVDKTISIDSYASKMGDDEDVITVAFSVKYKSAAEDLMNFIEKGYQFVLDADLSKGEMSDGKYLVFVELERDPKSLANITEMLYGISKVTDFDDFKFKYYNSFTSYPVIPDNLKTMVPTSPAEYKSKIKTDEMENYENFFKTSMLESISVNDGDITFKRIYRDPLRLSFIASGTKASILESITDRISISSVDVSEVLYLTKYIGNYNITKFGNNTFMMENNGYAIKVEMK